MPAIGLEKRVTKLEQQMHYLHNTLERIVRQLREQGKYSDADAITCEMCTIHEAE